MKPFGAHLSSQDRVLIFCVCILDMFISIITDMHVDNQIRWAYYDFCGKTKKGEILINWRTLKKKFKKFLKIIFENLAKICNFLATLHLCTKNDPKNGHPYCICPTARYVCPPWGLALSDPYHFQSLYSKIHQIVLV